MVLNVFQWGLLQKQKQRQKAICAAGVNRKALEKELLQLVDLLVSARRMWRQLCSCGSTHLWSHNATRPHLCSTCYTVLSQIPSKMHQNANNRHVLDQMKISVIGESHRGLLQARAWSTFQEFSLKHLRSHCISFRNSVHVGLRGCASWPPWPVVVPCARIGIRNQPPMPRCTRRRPCLEVLEGFCDVLAQVFFPPDSWKL